MELKLYLSILFLTYSLVALAQPAPPATPIDGGLGLLLAGGAAYGVKQLMGRKKNI